MINLIIGFIVVYVIKEKKPTTLKTLSVSCTLLKIILSTYSCMLMLLDIKKNYLTNKLLQKSAK